MQTTSALYKTLFLLSDTYKEWRISVNNTQYGQDVIVKEIDSTNKEPVVSRPTFLDTPSVGSCFAAQFTCTFLLNPSYIPRMATIIPSYRLRNGNQASEWVTVGTFYVDVRTYDKASQTVDLVCYDDMLKTDGVEGKPYAELTQFDEWPQPMTAVVQEICTIIGVPLDSRSVVNTGTGYMIGYPNNYTMREVLGYVAAAHGGNFVISPAKTLRLIRIVGSTDVVTSLGEQDLSIAEAFSAWSKVTLYYGDEEAYESGTDSGRTLEAEDPWAEQSTATGILSGISGVSYQPFSIAVCLLDPAAEIGDTLIIPVDQSTLTVHVWSMELYCDSSSVSSIGAPGESAIDHEYPYLSASARQMRRMVKLGQPYYGVTISKQKGIEIVGYDGNNNEINRALFNSAQFEMDAKIDGSWQRRLYFDPITGDYVFEGRLGADSIYTDSLYAEQGDIAELTVDRLSTSRRIRKYILGDTSDDNYVKIQDNYIRLMTGTVDSSAALGTEDDNAVGTEDNNGIEVQGTPSGAVHVSNRYGQPLYWQREPVGHTADGYPTDANGQQIYAGTEETSWPVYSYAYTEQVKSEYSFVSIEGVYNPQIIIGAGDENGYSKGYVYKSIDYLLIQYITPSGDPAEIRLNNDGYVDITKLRKSSQLDFSGWDSGVFTEMVDGGGVSSYAVSFDAYGRPTRITDNTGHIMEVVW